MRDELALTQLPTASAREAAGARSDTAGETLAPPPGMLTPRPVGAATPSTPVVPRYEVLGELGRGGMGVVYKARDIRLNRLVALKMVLGDGKADPDALLRFLAEAEASAAVRHPNVVQVYEAGEADGWPFLALEYLPGGTLATRLRTAGRIPPTEAADLLRQIALGVAAAHAAGIVHRDLKPANVLFQIDESPSATSQSPVSNLQASIPKVTDFGLAKRGLGGDLTATGAVMGTPQYMAPEQARGDAKAARPPADVWALGVILYECLTGTVPFATESPLSTLKRLIEEPPQPPRKVVPAIPRDLEAICLKCLEKDPADRYPIAQELADDLTRFLAGEPLRGPRSGFWYHARRTVTRKWRRAASALVVGGGLIAVWLIPSPLHRAPAPAAPTDVERKFAVVLCTANLPVQVLEEDETVFDGDYRGQRITAIGLSYPVPTVHAVDLSAAEERSLAERVAAPLEDVELVITLTCEDDTTLTMRRFYGLWRPGEPVPRRIDVPPQRYQRVEIHGTATRHGLKVEINRVWKASAP